MPILFRDDILEKLERSRAYLIFDMVFNWIGGIGDILLVVCVSVLYWGNPARFTWRFWLGAFLLMIGLLAIRGIKDQFVAWAGVAPPNYAKWFGAKQIDVASPRMSLIRDAQSRAGRMKDRGIRVDELLEENEARFERQVSALD